jgi:SAM-dependent methyltransferase
MPDGKQSKKMRRDWDERARKDAYFYIATWEKDWDPHRFFDSGEADVRTFVDPALQRQGFLPQGKTMLEIGAGVGRMTRSFARRFAHVVALDVSPEMLSRGHALHGEYGNILWLQGDGIGLSMIAENQMDFVFSYIVLHHIPSPDLVFGYIREMLRVLRPGGVFLFQFNSFFGPSMNWKGRLIWGVIDRLREPVFGMSFDKLGRWLSSSFGLDELAAGRTWRGAALEVRKVLDVVQAAGGEVVEMTGPGTPATWCLGRKQLA